MPRLILYTSNYVSRDRFFRAGGVRFIVDLLPYLAGQYDVVFYVAGPRNESFEYAGTEIHIVKSPRIPFTDKGKLPKINDRGDVHLFLDYAAALSPNYGPHNLVVMHHLARSFRDEDPLSYYRYFGIVGEIYAVFEDRVLRRVQRRVDLALAVSDVSVPYLREMGFNVAVVGNGVDVKRYRPAKKRDYAVFIGRLVGYKRVDLAIRLAERLGIELKVVGTGPEEDHLKRIAGTNVEFLGYLGEEDKIRVLSRAKYLFSFSAFEGFDLPVIEALACGTVPVVSRIRAHEFIASGSDAVVLTDTVDEAARSVRAMEGDPQLYRRRSREGRLLAEKRWSAEKIAGNYLEILDRYV